VSFLGTIVGGLKGAVTGLVTGGPLGAIKGGLTGAVTAARGGTAVATPSIAPRALPSISTFAALPAPGGFDTSRLGPMGTGTTVPTPGFLHGSLSRFLPGGESGYSSAPPGYHINKRYLAFYRAQAMGRPRQDPTTAQQVVNVVVRNRKMNPLNPRALARANARQTAAVRMMRRTLKGSGYSITRRGFGKKKTRSR